MKFAKIGLIGLIALAQTGCSTLGLGGDKVEIKPESRTNETWGYIHQAEDLTGMKFRGSLLWEYRKFTRMADYDNDGDLDPSIWHPDMGWIGGWTAYYKGGLHTETVYGPDGKLGPLTGLTEAIRVVMRSNGHTPDEVDAWLDARGMWK